MHKVQPGPAAQILRINFLPLQHGQPRPLCPNLPENDLVFIGPGYLLPPDFTVGPIRATDQQYLCSVPQSPLEFCKPAFVRNLMSKVWQQLKQP
jgi:hypothetical protein